MQESVVWFTLYFDDKQSTALMMNRNFTLQLKKQLKCEFFRNDARLESLKCVEILLFGSNAHYQCHEYHCLKCAFIVTNGSCSCFVLWQ